MLVDTAAAPPRLSPPVTPLPTPALPAPILYTPRHLAERIRAEQAAMEAKGGDAGGERKTISALFADMAGSTALIQDLDPEEARSLIDPVVALMMEAVHHYVESSAPPLHRYGPNPDLQRDARLQPHAVARNARAAHSKGIYRKIIRVDDAWAADGGSLLKRTRYRSHISVMYLTSPHLMVRLQSQNAAPPIISC